MFLGANLLRTWLHYACPGASHSDKQHGNVEQPQSNVVAQCSRRCRVKCKTGGTQTFVATRRYRLQNSAFTSAIGPGGDIGPRMWPHCCHSAKKRRHKGRQQFGQTPTGPNAQAKTLPNRFAQMLQALTGDDWPLPWRCRRRSGNSKRV